MLVPVGCKILSVFGSYAADKLADSTPQAHKPAPRHRRKKKARRRF